MADRALIIVGIGVIVLAIVASIGAVMSTTDTGRAPSEPVFSSNAANLSGRVPPGEVATSIRLDAVAGVAGGIRAGDVIDLYAFFPSPLSEGVAATRVILRETLVYGVARDGGTQTLILAMAPGQAVQVQQALQLGARPLAAIRPSRSSAPPAPAAFSDADFAGWLTRVATGG